MDEIRQRHRTKAEREEILSEFLESGLTQREFCEERQIGLSTFQYWLRKTRELADGEDSAEITAFVEVRLEAPSEAHGSRAGFLVMKEYDLVLSSGRRLVVRSGYDRSEVAVLLELLEQR